MQLVPVCQSFRFLSWLKPLSLGSSPPLPVHAAWLPESSFWNVDQILPVSGSESFSGCLFGEWNLGPPVSHSRPVIAWPESSLYLNCALSRLSCALNRTTLVLWTYQAASSLLFLSSFLVEMPCLPHSHPLQFLKVYIWFCVLEPFGNPVKMNYSLLHS